MRIPKIEAPSLSVPARKMPARSWIHSRQRGSILSVPLQGVTPVAERFDTVVLEYVLNYRSGLEGMRKDVRDALDLTKTGGIVIAVSRACDSGCELAEAMVRMGVPPDDLGVSNLTNKEIACLRPKEAVLLVSHVTLRQADLEDYPESAEDNRQKALEFARRVRKSAVEPDIRGTFPEKFVTKIIDIGLVWHHR